MARKWWTLLATCVATFMLLLDITIVNVALPSIQSDLGASFSDLQWVVDAYALTLAALLLTAGSLGDRLGRRAVFTAGFAVFTAASLLCGISTDPTMLNVFRAVQGIGGAAMFATTLALIAQEFEGPERGTALGIWGAMVGGGVAVGPLLGGALTDGLGWQWVFFVNVPIGIAAIALTLLRVGESRARDAQRIDWPGVVTFSAALFLLVFGLIRGNEEGWSSFQISGSLAGAVVLLLAFLAVELRSPQPMFELGLFRKPAFIGSSAVAFTLSVAVYSMLLFITIYIQSVLGYDAFQAGLRFLPYSLLPFLISPAAGRLLARVPARVYFGLGLGLVGAGLLLMRGLDPGSGWTALLAGLLLAGAGNGVLNPAIASTAVGVVNAAKAGMGSGVSNTARQVGLATGIAAWGAIFESGIASRLPAGAPDDAAKGIAASGTRAVEQGGPQAVDAARNAFVGSLNELFLIAAIVAFAGAAAGLLLTRERDLVAPGSQEAAAEVAASGSPRSTGDLKPARSRHLNRDPRPRAYPRQPWR